VVLEEQRRIQLASTAGQVFIFTGFKFQSLGLINDSVKERVKKTVQHPSAAETVMFSRSTQPAARRLVGIARQLAGGRS
jgi:hypothetical protein